MQVLGAHHEVRDVELVLDVPAHGPVVSPLLHYAVEEAEGVQQPPEHGLGLAPGVELVIHHQVGAVEADQVGLDALGPLDNNLNTSLKLNKFITNMYLKKIP